MSTLAVRKTSIQQWVGEQRLKLPATRESLGLATLSIVEPEQLEGSRSFAITINAIADSSHGLGTSAEVVFGPLLAGDSLSQQPEDTVVFAHAGLISRMYEIPRPEHTDQRAGARSNAFFPPNPTQAARIARESSLRLETTVVEALLTQLLDHIQRAQITL
jgi:hypothetical protein